MSETISHLSTKTLITFVGDKTAARAYVGEANKLLFQHRQFMEGGKTASTMRRQFEDSGVTMMSTIINGQEHVTITAPVRGGGEEADRIEELVVPYIRGFAEGSPDDNLDVYFILDWRLRFRGVRKKIRKHLFVENTAEIEEDDVTSTRTDARVATVTNMHAVDSGPPWITLYSGRWSATYSATRRASWGGSVLLNGSGSTTSSGTDSHDYPEGGDIEEVNTSTTFVSDSTASSMPLSVYGTPLLGPVVFSYDNTFGLTMESERVYTRTWDSVSDPPRWWNPTTITQTRNDTTRFVNNYSTYLKTLEGARETLSTAGWAQVGSNTAAAIRKDAPAYAKVVDGETYHYARPSAMDVLLAAWGIETDARMWLQLCHRGISVRAELPSWNRSAGGVDYTLMVPGVESGPPTCEFGLCTLRKKRLETDPKSESGYAPYARKKG